MNRRIELTDDLLHEALRVDEVRAPLGLSRTLRDAIAAAPAPRRIALPVPPLMPRIASSVMPRSRWLAILTALLIAALAAAAVLIGSRAVLPPPVGLARTGLLAFGADGDIHVAQANGSGKRALVATDAHETSPVWSPDGARIVYQIDSQPPVYGGTSLWVMDAEGTHARRVSGDTGILGGYVSWSPDGDEIAFISIDRELVVAAADGSGMRRLVAPGQRRHAPAWSPDGSRIAYLDSVSGAVYVTDPGGEVIERVSDGKADRPLSWSNDGSELRYATLPASGVQRDATVVTASRTDEGWAERQLAPRDGERLASGATGCSGPCGYGPRWSNAGDRFAFLAPYTPPSPEPIGHELRLARADGSDMRTVVQPVLMEPCWSPDDRWIAVVLDSGSEGEAGRKAAGIVVLATDGGEPDQEIGHFAREHQFISGCSWQRLAP
jgi:Tol biopolymer transport system component